MAINQDSRLQPTVTIRQGTVVGAVQHGLLPGQQPVEAFRGIPYALPPLGPRRFKRPEKVPDSTDTIDATKFGPTALLKTFIKVGPLLEQSEDCLTANVFRQVPSNRNGPLPVMIYLHGGAFNRGTASMHDTASMVSWSAEPFVAVSFNYRVGSLGFLPSTVSAREGILNLGLRDQILLFEWVQENIEAFGGDKNNITLMGLSAGAHSIGHHILRHNEKNPGPFHRAIINSGAPTSRVVRKFDADLHEQQFREFLHEVGCPPHLSDTEILPFLRSAPIADIVRAQNTVFDRYNPSLLWAFQPVIDGDLIKKPPIDVWHSGDYYKIPIMTGFCNNEGSLYVDKQMSSPQQFTNFFRTLLPGLSNEDITTITKLYPDPSDGTDDTYLVPGTMSDVGSQYRRVEAAYAEYAYIAPVRETARLASANQVAPIYLYQWALQTTVAGGASHGDNMRYETCTPDVVKRSRAQEELAGVFHAYMTSFICHKGDPNALDGEWSNRPIWSKYTSGDPKVMLFGKGNQELIGGGIGVSAQLVNDGRALEACKFWSEKSKVCQE